MTRRGRRRGGDDRVPEYTPEEVEKLTQRADDLLRQLHDVLGEMAEHLATVAKGGDGR